ncbi:MAG TPA: oligosaccharide flippase family protein [Solirubrobacteraceae bacterium]|nr:oligosaccharide flippase family protein [Solirubrobacteraceae bacterium]
MSESEQFDIESALAADEVDVLDTSAAGPAAVRGGALRVISYGAGSLVSAGAAALLFRQLGLHEVGRYVTAVSIVAIVGGFTDLGLNAVGLRDGATLDGRGRSELFANLLGLRLVLTTVGLGIALLIVAVGYPAIMVAAVGLAGVGLVAQTAGDNLGLMLQVRMRVGTIAGLELLRQVLTAAGMLVLFLVGAGLLAFVAVSIPVGLVVLAIVSRLVRHERRLRPSFSWSRWRPMLARVGIYAAATTAAILYFRVAIVMVSQLADRHQEGLFGASYRVIDFLTLVPGILAGTALPIFARSAGDDHERFSYALGRVFQVALIAGAGTALVISVGAPFIMEVLGGAQFSGAAGVLSIQAIGLGATFVGIVWANGMLSLSLFRQILIINLIALTGIIVLLSILVPADGAHGAAIGTATGEFFGALACGVVVVRRHPALLASFRTVPLVALALAAAVATLAIPGLGSLAQAVISGAVYLLALALLRAYPAELDALVPARLRALRG